MRDRVKTSCTYDIYKAEMTSVRVTNVRIHEGKGMIDMNMRRMRSGVVSNADWYAWGECEYVENA